MNTPAALYNRGDALYGASSPWGVFLLGEKSWERLWHASKQAAIALEDGLKALKTLIIPMWLPRRSPACSLREIWSISLFFSLVFHWVHPFLRDFWVKIASHVQCGLGFVQTDVPVTPDPLWALGFG